MLPVSLGSHLSELTLKLDKVEDKLAWRQARSTDSWAILAVVIKFAQVRYLQSFANTRHKPFQDAIKYTCYNFGLMAQAGAGSRGGTGAGMR